MRNARDPADMSSLVSDVLNLSSAPTLEPATRILPDVADDSVAAIAKTLDRVGMDGIEVALRWIDDDGVTIRVPGRAEATVSLDDPAVKGIHMSRLFLALQDGLDSGPLTPVLLNNVLERFLVSHEGISRRSFVALDFEHLTRRESLLSGHSGWRSYPIHIETSRGQERDGHLLRLRITYSSTCPCSAALSRQLIQEGFCEAFQDHRAVPIEQVAAWLGTQQAIAALPHSQRSHAEVTVRLSDDATNYPIDDLIECCETALGTAVQAAVKRPDEQEFARLNAEQLMFCEDAARILARALDGAENVEDYHVRVRHLESLHPHDAVAEITKGIEGGL